MGGGDSPPSPVGKTLVGLVKNGHGHLVHEIQNLLYNKNEFMNCADFLHD